jgi:hypothetical protein
MNLFRQLYNAILMPMTTGSPWDAQCGDGGGGTGGGLPAQVVSHAAW